MSRWYSADSGLGTGLNDALETVAPPIPGGAFKH
jgi:hypothetical protein